MAHKVIFGFLLVFIAKISVEGQIKTEQIAEKQGVTLRGLSVINDSTFWVAGSKGTVGRCTNGKTIQWITVPGHATADFRDIEATDANTALIMAITRPAQILQTTDAGHSWQLVFEYPNDSLFLDAIHLHGRRAIALGDALRGRMFLAKSNNKGKTWKVVKNSPAALGAEGCFASSGSNVILHKKNTYFVSGGPNSRFFAHNKSIALPIRQASETSGANSLAISPSGQNMIVVGGDFTQKDNNKLVACYSHDAGRSFQLAHLQPDGYRSCVIFSDEHKAISCGLNGVDISLDAGRNWQNISSQSYHVCQKAPNSNVIWLAGNGGRVAYLFFP
jgi:photosystem II stability/assembly factor-like uncharacterized protein